MIRRGFPGGSKAWPAQSPFWWSPGPAQTQPHLSIRILHGLSDKSDWRIFTRCIQVEGQGYEYVIFFHPSEKKSICLFQPGPYLEGAPGFAHGGSLATMMDETFSKTAYLAGEGLFTVSLNIRFKNLIPVGSLAVLNVHVEKIEDQKLYMSCIAQSRDQQTVYAKCSGIFLQLQLEEESPQ
ncbi:acyl-coenzyme A thioesterase THEM5 isoform X4 [Canis lupus familiaris]|uniref:acyl-coenzyme A thioesterase THEM5 isoform X4 n=1 Tax=Canis lupus familiaris TaxID=9615 RepID=UPI0018F4BC47|nr:acyl-coenzyme A thioesterase THEM5 isoform X4 [Canis lupus familiaris]